MTIHEHLMKAIQEDARRAGERDRLLLEARRARGAGRRRLVTLDGVVQDPAVDDGFAPGGRVGLIATRPQLATLVLDDALAARALLLGRRSYARLAARWRSHSGELADRRLAASDGGSRAEMLAGASPGHASGKAPSEQQVGSMKPVQ